MQKSAIQFVLIIFLKFENVTKNIVEFSQLIGFEWEFTGDISVVFAVHAQACGF